MSTNKYFSCNRLHCCNMSMSFFKKYSFTLDITIFFIILYTFSIELLFVLVVIILLVYYTLLYAQCVCVVCLSIYLFVLVLCGTANTKINTYFVSNVPTNIFITNISCFHVLPLSPFSPPSTFLFS